MEDSHPLSQVDWHHWINFQKLGLWKLVALSVGTDPRALPIDMRSPDGDFFAECSTEYVRRLELAIAHLGSMDLVEAFVPSKSAFAEVDVERFVQWARGLRVPLDIPQELAQLTPDANAVKRSELDDRERTSLLKLLLGMAIGRYKYNPEDAKSTAVQPIVEDVKKAGLTNQ